MQSPFLDVRGSASFGLGQQFLEDAHIGRLDQVAVEPGLRGDAPVVSCYEAGRDGFWLHRFLTAQTIANHVVDSSSIEVKRRGRRCKTDRLDVGKLLSMLIRWHHGEKNVWSVVQVPGVVDEDRRQLHRDLLELKAERTQHTNRITGLLMLLNLRVRNVGGRAWQQWWDDAAAQVPSHLRAQIERENERLKMVQAQIRQLEGKYLSWTL